MAEPAFDPDAYLGAKSEPKPSATPSAGFDPDAYLSSAPPTPSVQFQQEVAAGKTAPRDRSRKEFGFGDIGTSGITGAVTGATMPELLQYGGRALKTAPFPQLQTIGAAAERLAPLVGGSRFSRAVGGGISGVAAESAGQAYEAADEPGLGAEAARLIVGGIPVSSPFKFLGGMAGKIARSATEGKINVFQAREQVARQREAAIRALGTPATIRDFDSLLTGIQQGVQSDVGLLNVRAAQIAADAEQYADDIIRAGEREADTVIQRGREAGERINLSAVTRAGDVARQYEQRIAQFKMETEAEAMRVLDEASKTAQRLRDSAAGKARDQRERMYQAAAQIEKTTQQQIQDTLRAADAEATRLRGLLSRAQKRAATSRGYVEEARSAIGQPVTETEFGNIVREPAQKQFEEFKRIREEQIKPAKEQIFQLAKNLEQSGQGYESTKAYKDAIEFIDRLLVDPETKRVSVTVPQLEKQLRGIKDALEGKKNVTADDQGNKIVQTIPGSFQSLEYLRRFLGDRASGISQEGFDAIGQKMASNLREMVQSIQDEFVSRAGQKKAWSEYLDRYRQASIPINKYKAALGEKLIGKQEWDNSQYSTDAAELGKRIFSSAGAVEAYQALSGVSSQEMQALARRYLANEIVNKGVKADALLRQNSDWLLTGPFQQVRADLQKLATRERVSGSTAQELLTKVRGRAVSGLKEALSTQKPIDEIVAQQAKARSSAISEGRKDVEATIKEGRAAGEKALKEGYKQAATVSAQAPKMERQTKAELKREQALIGKQAAGERSAVEKAAKEESKQVIDAAKERAKREIESATDQAKIPADQAKQLQSALNGLTETPAKAFERLVFGTDPVGQLNVFAPYIKATTGGLEAFQKGVVEGLVKRAKGDGTALLRDWETIVAPAIVGAGLMPPKEASRITQELVGLQSINQGNIKQMTILQTTLTNLIRTAISQIPAGTGRLLDAAMKETSDAPN